MVRLVPVEDGALFSRSDVAALAGHVVAVGVMVAGPGGGLGRVVAAAERPGSMVRWWVVRWGSKEVSVIAEPLLAVRS